MDFLPRYIEFEMTVLSEKSSLMLEVWSLRCSGSWRGRAVRGLFSDKGCLRPGTSNLAQVWASVSVVVASTIFSSFFLLGRQSSGQIGADRCLREWIDREDGKTLIQLSC